MRRNLFIASIVGVCGAAAVFAVASLQVIDSLVEDRACLARLEVFPTLRALHLSGGNLSDDQMNFVGDLMSLEELDLDSSPITAAACRFLGRFSNLKLLHLAGTRITDDGLAYLEPLKQLHSLRLTSDLAMQNRRRSINRNCQRPTRRGG